MTSPSVAEPIAGTGFDGLLIDGEQAPNDVGKALAQLQAVAACPVHPIVRPVQGEVALIKRLLDIGLQTLLRPMVDTAERAARMLAAARYPPRGRRGVGRAGIALECRRRLPHSDVIMAIANGMAAVKTAGMASGIIQTDCAEARRFLDPGASFVAVGVDALLLASAARALAADFIPDA